MYQAQRNFARILTLQIGDNQLDCVCHREGPVDVHFTFSIIDEENDEMITPTVKMEWPYKQVVDRLFDEDNIEILTAKATEAWAKVDKALA